MAEIKCEHCGTWTDGNVPNCVHCGGRHGDKYLKEREELEKIKTGLPLIEIDPHEALPKKVIKHIARFGQLIFFGLISIIAAMAASTVH